MGKQSQAPEVEAPPPSTEDSVDATFVNPRLNVSRTLMRHESTPRRIVRRISENLRPGGLNRGRAPSLRCTPHPWHSLREWHSPTGFRGSRPHDSSAAPYQPTIDWHSRTGRIKTRPHHGNRPTIDAASLEEFREWWQARESAREERRNQPRVRRRAGKTEGLRAIPSRPKAG